MNRSVLFLSVLLCLLFALPAYAVPNPMTEYSSLDEINAIVGCSLCGPGVMGITDETYYVIDCVDFRIAQYSFRVNGTLCCLRAAPVYDADISGVYIDAKPAFESGLPAGTEYAEGEGLYLARWANMDGQYVCTMESSSADPDTFRMIAEELVTLTDPAMSPEELAAYYLSICGEYIDETGGRAFATLTARGEWIEIMIEMPQSASEAYLFTMTARLSEDGLLYYSDCVSALAVYGNDGAETKTVLYENGSGFLGESEGILYWNGAQDEMCRDCVFVPVGE